MNSQAFVDKFFDFLAEQERGKRVADAKYVYGMGKAARLPCAPFLLRLTQVSGMLDVVLELVFGPFFFFFFFLTFFLCFLSLVQIKEVALCKGV